MSNSYVLSLVFSLTLFCSSAVADGGHSLFSKQISFLPTGDFDKLSEGGFFQLAKSEYCDIADVVPKDQVLALLASCDKDFTEDDPIQNFVLFSFDKSMNLIRSIWQESRIDITSSSIIKTIPGVEERRPLSLILSNGERTYVSATFLTTTEPRRVAAVFGIDNNSGAIDHTFGVAGMRLVNLRSDLEWRLAEISAGNLLILHRLEPNKIAIHEIYGDSWVSGWQEIDSSCCFFEPPFGQDNEGNIYLLATLKKGDGDYAQALQRIVHKYDPKLDDFGTKASRYEFSLDESISSKRNAVDANFQTTKPGWVEVSNLSIYWITVQHEKFLAIGAFGTNGESNEYFSGDGFRYVYMNDSSYFVEGESIVVTDTELAADGTIYILVSATNSGGGRGYALVKVLSNGDLDYNFADQGIFFFKASELFENSGDADDWVVQRLILDATGQPVVLGYIKKI